MKILNKVGIGLGIVASFFFTGCGGVGIAEAGVPTISQIVPQSLTAGTGDTTVQIVGSQLNAATVVLWNGNPLATTLLNSTTVASPVTSASLATPGIAQLQLMNSATGSKSPEVELKIGSPSTTQPLTITTTSVPNGTVGVPYNATLTATGGTAPYKWTYVSGNAPAGLSLNPDGTAYGTPTKAGTYSVGLTVQDSSKPAQVKFIALTVIISKASAVATTPLSVSTSSLAAATYGTTYSQTLAAAGGTPAYTWGISSGSLPQGLTLNESGTISGTPAQGGTFPFTVSLSDSGSPRQSATQPLSITVNEIPLKIANTSLAAGTAGSAYSQTLTATGGSPAYTWGIASGSLPAGLTLSSSGVISGTPSAIGTGTFVALVRDSGNPVQSQSATFSIVVSPTQLKVTQASIAQGMIGRPYSGTLQATGGTPGYTWSVSSGSLPAGLTLNLTGAISGTPAASGTAAFTATVKDSGSPTQSVSSQVSINVAPAPLTITAATLPSVNVSSAYSQTLQATGGTAPYVWSITSGQLPAGLTLSPTTGAIIGTPSTAGTSTFTATATDSSNPVQTASVVFSILVNPAQSALASAKQLSIIAPASSSGSVGSTYSQTLGATGGTSPYTWSITSGSLPSGLLLSSAGVITGTPATGTSGSYSITVTVSDSETPAQTASATMAITVSAAAATPLSIVSSTLPSGTSGTAYSQTLQATGGTPGYTWTVSSGSLPSGLGLSASGAISGTPSASGTSTFTATVTDSSSPAQTQSITASISIAASQASTSGTTWYVRPDGGTRYSANVPNGQCNGKYDAPYPGAGVNQNCAYNDFRYMWDDGSGMVGAGAWVIAGGDTVIIRGCSALPGQTNPSNPDCRIGWDGPTGNPPNLWCYGVGSYTCYNPPIPAGTAAQHTRILGQNYANCAVNGATNPQLYASNLTQLFGGFSLQYTFNLQNTKYVDIECIELTTHNGQCTSSGSPSYPRPCSNNQPLDDYALNGFWFNNASSNITLQDVYVHGFNSSGFNGPIGGPINMTRVFSGFNAFAGWNFDDGSDTPDAAGSQILASYVTMIGNGCYEQYPIVNTQFPARACYDDVSNGFGDAWSGQDTELDVFTCDHCVTAYNTKDAFIGPHTNIEALTVTNSSAIGNMGAQWKWNNAPGGTVIFVNNLTIGNCARFADLTTPIPGASQIFASASGLGGAYLSNYCRAGGNLTASNTQASSTVLFANNTYVNNTDSSADIFLGCGPISHDMAGNCNTTTISAINNIFLGYTMNGAVKSPVAFETDDSSITFTPSYNISFGNATDAWSQCGTNGQICSDPLLINEPAQAAYTVQSFLDNFDFHPSSNSPALGAGTAFTGMLGTDYYGITRPIPPTIGAVQQ